jgi:3-methylcrotonyl-CoA carboxylase alpha subunit
MTEKNISIAGQQFERLVEHDRMRFRVGDLEVEVLAVRPGEAELRIGERTHLVPFVVHGTTISFAFAGQSYTADVTDKGARAKAKHRDHSMGAPMPGVVLKILVEKGAAVTRGTPLVILEAMKMEHQIIAPKDGVVAAIHCSEGELVQPGTDLVELAEA